MVTLADKMRAVQGQLPPVKITVFTTGEERLYTFTKLKRKECHETLYNLVKPLITIVKTFIENVKGPDGKPIDLEKLAEKKEGKDEDIDLISFKGLDMNLVGQVFDSIPFDQFWLLASKLLRNVVIDGVPIDDFEKEDENSAGYYDDKQVELIQAVYTSAMVNYPFLSGFLKKGKKSKDSNQSEGKSTK